MKWPRDSQKSRLYAAENAVRQAIGDKAMTDRIAAWAWIEKVERDKWFRRTFGYWKFRISDGRGTSIARGGNGHLNLPRWSRTPMVMLHEIAHNVTPGGVDDRHGWQYAATFLKLVKHFLGQEVHDKLRVSFKQHRVRYTKPRKGRPLTDEQRLVLVARLASYRVNRKAAKPPIEHDAAHAKLLLDFNRAGRVED